MSLLKKTRRNEMTYGHGDEVDNSLNFRSTANFAHLFFADPDFAHIYFFAHPFKGKLKIKEGFIHDLMISFINIMLQERIVLYAGLAHTNFNCNQ